MVVSSDLRRAAQTAALIGGALGQEVVVDPRLRERSLGTAEGLPSELLGPDRSGVAGGVVVDADAAPAGGESVRQLYERAVACLSERLRQGDGDLVLVCHGGVVRVLTAWLAGAGPDGMAWPEVDNGSPVRVAATRTALVG
jgi:broad specificity phosphatase PhoE